MDFLSIFRKPSQEQVKQEIVDKIVISALRFRESFPAYNNKLSADAGAEMLMLLIYLFDKAAFRVVGPTSRNAIWDEVSRKACIGYHKAILSKGAPDGLFEHDVRNTFKNIDYRQDVYSRCESLSGVRFPGRGSVVFAFSYFVHLALGETARRDVEAVLVGKCDVSEGNSDAFPEFDIVTQNAVWVGSIVNTIGFEGDLKKLK